MISRDGWNKYCIWEHSSNVRDLYRRRASGAEPEMDAAGQAAEILRPLVRPGDTLLDAGCGSGYFFHSLRSRSIPAEYYGIDAAPSLIEIGREELGKFGLPSDRLQTLRIEDLDCSIDHILCINVLSNIDNYHRPLERLLLGARKSVILRESCAPEPSCAYVADRFLDPGHDLKVYVQTYAIDEVLSFIRTYGFNARAITDRRTNGQPENVIGYPHHWTFIEATKGV